VRSARRAAGAGPHRCRRLQAQGRRVVLADLLTTEAEALADEFDGHAYRCDVTDSDEDFWDTIIDINDKGTLRTCHAVLPGMTERGWGRIVNFASAVRSNRSTPARRPA
jgi:NADP-dependent 3-hydroxy acid dehydrogenase YdfG